ncbi:polymeric immunoglobulin receptor-like [Myripristis murdjan]|uniref:polymeric immunoglobulin receptor-like n=1 Tax=Myripristis murdjan TaxID=586833 RepID=UPI001175DE75|nr:polymeric immunoglobulin receptor-like [Myripristis murdjan]
MWSLQKTLFILCIALKYSPNAASVIHVFGYEGREAEVSCRYDAGYESYSKYLCRGECDYTDVLIETGQTKKGRYSFSDDKNKRIFIVTISDLNYKDGGKYWCGVTRTGKDLYKEVKLQVVSDMCCGEVSTAQGEEGSPMSISCPYPPEHQHNLKYLCRGKRPSTCLRQAVITSNNSSRGRFSIHDDKVAGNFTVTISRLTPNDSGSYLCGVHITNGLDVFSAVELEVKDALHVNSVVVIVPVGLAGGLILTIVILTIVCKRKRGKIQDTGLSMNTNTSKTAKINKIRADVACTELGSSKLQSGFQHNDNSDDEEPDYQNLGVEDDIYCNQVVIEKQKTDVENSLRVTISALQKEDEGAYRCGVKNAATQTNYTEVNLHINDGRCCSDKVTHTAFTGGNVDIMCNYSEEHRDSIKYFCKEQAPVCDFKVASGKCPYQLGRFSLSESRNNDSFTVTIRELTKTDKGSYWCGAVTQTAEVTYIALITKIILKVQNWKDYSFQPIRFDAGENATLGCPYLDKYQNSEKFFCKSENPHYCHPTNIVATTHQRDAAGRFSLEDDSAATLLKLHIRNVTKEDAGIYWCGTNIKWTPESHKGFNLTVELLPRGRNSSSLTLSPAAHGTLGVIAVPVSLVVMLLVAVLFFNYRHQKKNHAKEMASPTHGLYEVIGNRQEVGVHDDL